MSTASSKAMLDGPPSEVFPLMTKAAFEETFGTPEERARRIAGSPKIVPHGDQGHLYEWMTESDFEIIFGAPEERRRTNQLSTANWRVATSVATAHAYPDRWIVVSGCKVVADEPTWEELKQKMEKLGLDRDTAVIQHIDTRNRVQRR